MVKFTDLSPYYKQVEDELLSVIKEVINETSFVYGKYVHEFETLFASKMNVNHCVGVGNGTDALVISLKCMGIGHGDEVITAANTFIATSEAISNVGAKPVFVDHDKYYGINPDLIKEKITNKTKAIIPVHLYGQSCDIEKIMNICKDHGLLLIEDTAQSHFVKYKNKFSGTFGDAACFSFYPSKNLGAIGDGGAIITNNDELAQKIRIYANHGSPEKYKHIIEGVNSRLDAIQAAVLKVNLKYIDQRNQQRQKAGKLYNKLLKNCAYVERPETRDFSDHFYHLYVIKTENRDDLRDFLSMKGIQTGIHYPTALPFLPCYKYLDYKPSDFPVSYKNQSKILSLPMFPEISENEIIFVTESIQEFFKNNN